MKLIQEIKQAEEKGENLKKNAGIEGQKLIELTRDKGEKAIAALDKTKEQLLDKTLTEAQKTIRVEIGKMNTEHEQNLKKIDDLYEKNKQKAIEKTQDLILKWPSSR